ncbi:MAG: hypothetical protein WAO00_19035, partial [Chthoniobacterales bacterium]
MATHTNCTALNDVWDGYGGVFWGSAIFATIALVVAGVWAALLAFGSGTISPMSMMVVAGILFAAALAGVIALGRIRDYFFNHRLACLDGDRCAIARIERMEADGDGDTALNVILAPADEKTDEPTYQTQFQAKLLVYVDPGLAGRGWHLGPFEVRDGEKFGAGIPFFHCEIEGTYFDDWTSALIAWMVGLMLLAVAAFALAAAATALGPIAWAVWIAVALLLLLLSLFGLHMAGDDDVSGTSGTPIGDTTPLPGGPIITDSGGNHLSNEDFVAILGRHVTDCGHADKGCWDELHNVYALAKIPPDLYVNAPSTHTGG